MPREIITTSDGSHSLLHTELNETYHSVHGAIQESKYVFIEKGLLHWLQSGLTELNVLEIGFGTGLNTLLCVQSARELQIRISYATLEAFPLSREIWSKLNYTDTLGDAEIFESIHESSWDAEHAILPNFLLKKYYSTLQDIKFLPGSFDVVFYDAFAPAKQPEMWTREMLGKITESVRPNGVFVTYCAKGQVKRDLASLGLVVETLAGPPGKKEMVRATRT